MTIDYVRAYARDEEAPARLRGNASGQIEAEKFSEMNGVQLETTTDAGGGQNVGWDRRRRLDGLQGERPLGRGL